MNRAPDDSINEKKDYSARETVWDCMSLASHLAALVSAAQTLPCFTDMAFDAPSGTEEALAIFEICAEKVEGIQRVLDDIERNTQHLLDSCGEVSPQKSSHNYVKEVTCNACPS